MIGRIFRAVNEADERLHRRWPWIWLLELILGLEIAALIFMLFTRG